MATQSEQAERTLLTPTGRIASEDEAVGQTARELRAPRERQPFTLIVWAMVLLGLGIYLYGIRQELPFAPLADEASIVQRAVRIAGSGDLNPGWFGHPGSTVVYPLAGIFHLTHSGEWLVPHQNGITRYQPALADYFLLGRLLSVAYAVLTIPLVYAVGSRVFGSRAGIIGASLYLTYPIVAEYAQYVRPEAAATFFGMLSLWLYCRMYDRPSAKHRLAAGLITGLAIGTRYFMVVLLPILVGVQLLKRELDSPQPNAPEARRPLPAVLGGILVTLAAAAVGFAVSTPFFFLDFPTAIGDLRAEATKSALGADGLSPLGNFLWYLQVALPGSVTWPQLGLAAIGLLVVFMRRRTLQVLLVAFMILFLIANSANNLHWRHWTFELLPLVALLAGLSVDTIARDLAIRLRFRVWLEWALIVLLVALASVQPVGMLITQQVAHGSTSTRVLARNWILENLPRGSRVAQESYTLPLGAEGFVALEQESLASNTLDSFRDDGFRHLVVSSYVYSRYFREPQRYQREVAFYEDLFNRGSLLKEFRPTATTPGHLVRVYELPEQDNTLIANGSFETGLGGWAVHGAGDPRQELETSRSAGGTNSLRFTSGTGASWVQYELVGWLPGDTVTYSIDTLTESGASAETHLAFHDSVTQKWSVIAGNPIPPDGQWHTLRGSAILPASTTSVYLKVFAPGATVVWVDNVQSHRKGEAVKPRVSAGAPETQLAVNGTFEQSSAGWATGGAGSPRVRVTSDRSTEGNQSLEFIATQANSWAHHELRGWAPGDTITYTVDVYAEPDANGVRQAGAVHFGFQGPNGWRTGADRPVYADKSWHRTTGSFKIPEGTTDLLIKVYSLREGGMFIDRLTVRKGQ